MRLFLTRQLARLRRRTPPHNNDGGRLRLIVQRVALTPVHGMEIRNGRWWAHTAWGHHPVEWYFKRAWLKHTEDRHAH